jgi:hypothetical protein
MNRRTNMKPLRFALAAVLLSFCPAAFAQHDHAVVQPTPSEAQKSFDTLKTLAGSWEGGLTLTPPMKSLEGTKMKVQIRVTSRGNALMHEMTMSGQPDNPITMLYVDGDRLALTHFCDAGNRPRMLAKPSPDGNTMAFEVTDVSGSTQKGNMADAVFTIVDANHHVEEWTYNFPGQKPVIARFDLQRTKGPSGPFGQ